MEELVKMVSDKTGLSEDKAKMAVETVVSFMKGKLPAPVAGQIDGLLSGKAADMGDIAKGLGGMLGGL